MTVGLFSLPLELFELVARYLDWYDARTLTDVRGGEFNISPWAEQPFRPSDYYYKYKYLEKWDPENDKYVLACLSKKDENISVFKYVLDRNPRPRLEYIAFCLPIIVENDSIAIYKSLTDDLPKLAENESTHSALYQVVRTAILRNRIEFLREIPQFVTADRCKNAVFALFTQDSVELLEFLYQSMKEKFPELLDSINLWHGLHFAAKHKQLGVIEWMFSRFPKTKSRPRPLYEGACESGDLEMVRWVYSNVKREQVEITCEYVQNLATLKYVHRNWLLEPKKYTSLLKRTIMAPKSERAGMYLYAITDIIPYPRPHIHKTIAMVFSEGCLDILEALHAKIGLGSISLEVILPMCFDEALRRHQWEVLTFLCEHYPYPQNLRLQIEKYIHRVSKMEGLYKILARKYGTVGLIPI